MHYLRTLLGAVEMLKGGVTSVHDDPFYVPEVTEELTNATMRAYSDAGIRATVSINMPNIVEYQKYPFLCELLPEEFRRKMKDAAPLAGDELIATYRRVISSLHCANRGLPPAAVSFSAPPRGTPEKP